MSNKHIEKQDQWSKASAELSEEVIKLASYDTLLLEILGDIKKKKILDYGCGPGILLKELDSRGADVYGFDISEELINKATEILPPHKLSTDLNLKMNVDVVICNLVLCIVEEAEVNNILLNIKELIKTEGSVYIGFCNPKIFNISESQLDLRERTSCLYEENHEYTKTKKEGGYTIIEKHRPIEWYRNVYQNNDFTIVTEYSTKEYEINNKKVEDFIIFEIKLKEII